MLASSWRRVIASGVLAAGLVWPVLATTQAQQAPPQEVPAELKSLLGAPQSEMRLVVQRYTLDRNTLNGNYLAAAAAAVDAAAEVAATRRPLRRQRTAPPSNTACRCRRIESRA